jgi:hypothetical protein
MPRHGREPNDPLVLYGAAGSGDVNGLQLIQDFLLVAAAVGVIVGTIRFFDRRRVRVKGGPEIDYNASQPFEAFVFYVRSEHDNPIVVEDCGIYGQDTVGKYWCLSTMQPGIGHAEVTKGKPHRWEIRFNDISTFGLDVRRRVYGYACLAQPQKQIWSRRTTAGPQRGPLGRSLPTPRSRNAGQPLTQPPWRVRWFK